MKDAKKLNTKFRVFRLVKGEGPHQNLYSVEMETALNSVFYTEEEAQNWIVNHGDPKIKDYTILKCFNLY